jgi:nicotinamide-nucleotide amidase
MFRETVAPLLRRLFPAIEPFVCRTLRTIELGESVVQEKIAKSLVRLVEAGLEVGYCARPGQVDVRLAARGESAEEWVSQAEQMIRALLGRNVFGTGEEDLEAVVIRLLAERNATLATAESCTGGYIAHCLTNVPGSSAVFRAGWVTYSDAAKQELLGVHTETLTRWGAVSDGVAREMAAGARRAGGTDYAIAVTGIAGPTGGTAEKPIGTVFIALASPRGTAVRHECNDWDRVTFKQVTARQALNQLRLALQTPK